MKRSGLIHAVLWFLIGAAALASGVMMGGDRPAGPPPKTNPCPGPLCPTPTPTPTPKPCPGPGPCPRDAHGWGPSTVGGRTSPDGSEVVAIDLPDSQHVKNVGGRDGSGCCVYASGTHAARWSNVRPMFDFLATIAKNENGGGTPGLVDQRMKKYAPGVAYCQYEGADLGVLRTALAAGLYPCVTYGYSPRYNGPVAHMVNLAQLGPKWAAVHDNNFPGSYEWMTPAEFSDRWTKGGGGWAWFLLAPPPPPIPTNGAADAPVFASGNTLGAVLVGPTAVQSQDLTGAGEGPGGNCFGVDWAAIQGGEHYSVNGTSCDAATFTTALIGGDQLLNNGNKLRVTVIGDDQGGDQVAGDLRRDPRLQAMAGRVLFQAYRPGEWAVEGVGLKATGPLTVVVQSPPGPDGRGRVLWRSSDYRDGVAALAAALRSADPNYDPTKDPGPDHPAPVGPGWPSCPNLPPWAWALLAVASYAVTYHGGGPLLQAVLDALRRALAGPVPAGLTPDVLARLEAALARLDAPNGGTAGKDAVKPL